MWSIVPLVRLMPLRRLRRSRYIARTVVGKPGNYGDVANQ
jgi:hypothetical protein